MALLNTDYKNILDFEKQLSNKFKFALSDFCETHYEVVKQLEYLKEKGEQSKPAKIIDIEENKGMGGFWELALEISKKFTLKYSNEEWEESDWFTTLWDFIELELEAK